MENCENLKKMSFKGLEKRVRNISTDVAILRCIYNILHWENAKNSVFGHKLPFFGKTNLLGHRGGCCKRSSDKKGVGYWFGYSACPLKKFSVC